MLKKFLIKQAMRVQLSKLPTEQRGFLENAFEKNPDLLLNIAAELQEKIKEGKDQMTAAREIAVKYQKELGGMIGKN